MIALEYHDVVADGQWDASGFPGVAAASYKLSTDDFEAHLEALSAPRFARQLNVAGRFGASSTSPALVLTFDDGGVSAYREIAPRLERRGWRGYFFVATDFIGTAGFLTSVELRELSSRGHVIGTHSASHPLRMSALGCHDMLSEWRRSIDSLAQILGAPVSAGSVPGGGYSRLVARTAAEAGLRTLFTSEPTTRAELVESCVITGRYTLRRKSSAQLAQALASGSVAPRLRQLLRWNAAKAAKTLGGPFYLRIRELLFEGILR